MRTIKNLYVFLLLAILLTACKKDLNLQPQDKITEDELFSDPEGVKLYMANLYNQMPTEDFTFFKDGFNYNGDNPNNGGFAPAMSTDEALHAEFADFIGENDFNWWEAGYKLIRDVNLFSEAIPKLKISQAEKDAYAGETAFIRAYAYFALAKRYGGVPLIKTQQQYNGDPAALKIPRSTEKDTWDFVLSECDVAVSHLGTAAGNRRANKWIALALKSRAALFAASVAKFGGQAPLSGDAVTQKLAGLDAGLANGYYQAAIAAADAIMSSGQYGLFRPSPANPAEAAENYRQLFENPNNASSEAIFIKGYTIPGTNYGHNYDVWYQPAQVVNGFSGRMNPTLELVDLYEDYTNPGHEAPVVTTTDGNVNDYNGYSPSRTYLHFDRPGDIFKNKDARLQATAILPYSTWKDITIIIQAGYIKPDGTAVIRANDRITVDGKTYYTYGAANPDDYSGFDTYGGEKTKTGFAFKKFMSTKPTVAAWNQSTTDFMDFRYAEILLNYAEAVVESGQGDGAKAAKAVNDIRRRAGHTVDIPLTVDNVQRERRVELAFENKRMWDLIRRREYHTAFNNRTRHSLMPVLDLRTTPAKYIFVRAVAPNTDPKTFLPKWYYRPIPGIGGNGLVQNPQY